MMGIIGVVLAYFFQAYPQIEPYRDLITFAAVTLATAVIFGIAIEDAAEKGREAARQKPRSLQESLDDLSQIITDEYPSVTNINIDVAPEGEELKLEPLGDPSALKKLSAEELAEFRRLSAKMERGT